MRLFFIVATGLAWIGASAYGAAGAENPASPTRWGGAANPNMVSEARHLPDDPGKAAPLWEIKVGTNQYSIPTIDRGRIYIAANDAAVDRPGYTRTGGGSVMCVAQATGKLLWQLPIPRYLQGLVPPFHFDQWRCGVCSGPVADGERVYIVSNRGEILCLDRQGQTNGNAGPFKDELKYMDIPASSTAGLKPSDGDIVWKYDLIRELDVVLHDVCGSTLLLQGDLLYACTSNGIDNLHDKVPRPLAPTLIVLDKKTGRLVARDDEKIGRRLLHCNWSSPCAGRVRGKNLIFFGGGDGILYAFEPPRPAPPGAGVQILKKVWSRDCNPPEYRVRDGKPVPHSTNDKRTADGASEIIGTAVFDKGRVYVAIGQSPIYGAGRGCLTCVDAASGAIVWSSQLVDRTTATAAIADGLLYIPDYTGNLHCFDAETGQRYWVHPLQGRTWCASAFVADGKVYAGTENNLLWVLKAGKEKQILSRTRLKSAPITPIAKDGVLYIPTQNTLIAIPGLKR